MKSLMTKLLVMLTAISVMTMFASQVEAKPRRMKALVVSGQNNHNWPVSHKVLKLILEQSGLFDVDIALTAPAGGDMSNFKPDFAAYDVVVLDYNGDRWPAETDAAFLEYRVAAVWSYTMLPTMPLPAGMSSTVSLLSAAGRDVTRSRARTAI